MAFQADGRNAPREIVGALKQGEDVELIWDGPIEIVAALQEFVGLKIKIESMDRGYRISICPGKDYQPSDCYHAPSGFLEVRFENNPPIKIQTTPHEPLGSYVVMAAINYQKGFPAPVVINSDEEFHTRYEIISFDPITAKLVARGRFR